MADFNVEDLQGLQALDYNLRVMAAIGYGVKSGATVTINNGTLGPNDGALSVGSGTVQVDGSDVSVNAQTVNLEESNTLPRKDVVYIDAGGSALVETGTPEPADPSGETGLDTERPAPHHFADLPGTPLCEVWVPANASSVDASNLYDRRVSPIEGLDTAADYTISGTWNFTGGLQKNGNAVATETWVNSQGFLTSDPDPLSVSELNTDEVSVGSPTNLSNLQLNYFNNDRPHHVVRGEAAIQIPDDSASGGSVGYAAKQQYITESGERIATLSADKVHNHWGIYTRAQPFDGVDYQPEKRLNVQGGAAEVNIDGYTIDELVIRGSNPISRLIGEAGSDPAFTISESDGNLSSVIQWDSSRQKTRLQSATGSGTTDMVELNGVDGQVEFNSHDLTGVSTMDGSADSVAPNGTTYREEDANSPWKVTSAQSTATYTIAGDYDRIHVDILRASSDGNTVENLRMRINGDTASAYDYITTSGTRVTDAAYLLLANHNTSDSYAMGDLQVMTSGTYNQVPVIGPVGFGGGGNDFLTGHWFGGSGDSVTDITLYYGQGQINDLVARVFGENF